MRSRGEPRESARPARATRTRSFVLLAGVLMVLGLVTSLAATPLGTAAFPRQTVALSLPQNGSSGDDPPASSAGLCPSGGPVILGVEWNCVAVLNLTELVLILVSIGIVAYVFKDADQAELPGDSAEVPITAEELVEYRRARKLGIPYRPPGPPRGGKEK